MPRKSTYAINRSYSCGYCQQKIKYSRQPFKPIFEGFPTLLPFYLLLSPFQLLMDFRLDYFPKGVLKCSQTISYLYAYGCHKTAQVMHSPTMLLNQWIKSCVKWKLMLENNCPGCCKHRLGKIVFVLKTNITLNIKIKYGNNIMIKAIKRLNKSSFFPVFLTNFCFSTSLKKQFQFLINLITLATVTF